MRELQQSLDLDRSHRCKSVLGHFHYYCREFRIVILTLSAANGEESPHFLRGATLYTISGNALADTIPVIEHLDGMNRYRAGLHIPGNVLVPCKKCTGEKRRDDGRKMLFLAESGWASFLSHDGSRCATPCATCRYWSTVWVHLTERCAKLSSNIERISAFRQEFPKFEEGMASLRITLPDVLAKLYFDCQMFAETEIKSLLERF